ncbi:ABC transporter permease [Nakamurella sp. PAMC28650]|uniref:ABC transporter permease n=1 Tax=Nakamurella sp. PAMC28650 TaxID=2762325 RepID=UPI00164ED1A6|nr:ABC transporter permease [Nakamurella sp. PAMC28650]QNK82496.1 ABC transporter permease [Nakamurella sp. PAMC28650]
MAVALTDSSANSSPRSRKSGVLGALRQTGGVQRGMLLIGGVITGIFVLMAILAPWISPYGFNDVTDAAGVRFPRLSTPSAAHWFGTTNGQGADVLSQVIYGSRTALIVVVLAVLMSLIIGVPLGLYSGYRSGWVDRVLVLITDALFAFPSLLLAIVVSIALVGGSSGEGGGILAASISITVIYIPQYFRVVRNATISAKQEPYVEAARAVGASPWTIMRRYLFGNVVQSVPIIATVNAADAILTLAGLGFLGFGIEPSSAAEWGYQLNKARSDFASHIWWTAVFPGLAIVLLVLGLSLIGESLNDVLNPLLRARRLPQVVMPGRLRRKHRSALGAEALPRDDSADAFDGTEQPGGSADGSMDRPYGQGTIGGTR